MTTLKTADIQYQCNLNLIPNLCSTLQEVAEGRGWLGLLSTQQRQRQYSLLAIRHQLRQRAANNVVRLHDLLANQATPVERDSLKSRDVILLSGVDKRYLAVCLASSVLQLYQTPWLGEDWGRHEIFFAREVSCSGKAMIRQPFVARSFTGEKRIEQPHSQRLLANFPFIRNKTVFGKLASKYS